MPAGSKITDDAQEFQFSLPFISPSGHEFSFYDTPDNQRLVIRHTSGSHMEFKADGSVFIKAVKDLHTHSSVASSQSAMAGGKISNNPIFHGAEGMYNGVIIRSSQDVTFGVHSTTGARVDGTRRAVLLGAQAVCMGYGKRSSEGGKYKWNEKLVDFDRVFRVSARTIWGMKKSVYQDRDYGTLVYTTYTNAKDTLANEE